MAFVVASRSNAFATTPTVVPIATVFVNFVRIRVSIDRCRNIELVEVIDRDIENLGCNRSIARRSLHCNRTVLHRGTSRLIDAAVVTTPVLASIGRDHRIACQAVGDRIRRCIEVEGVSGNAYGRTYRHILIDAICRCVGIGRC